MIKSFAYLIENHLLGISTAITYVGQLVTCLTVLASARGGHIGGVHSGQSRSAAHGNDSNFYSVEKIYE